MLTEFERHDSISIRANEAEIKKPKGNRGY